MTDQTQRLEIATVRAEIGSNITYRFNNDAIDAGGIPTESGNIKNLKLIIKEIEDKASVSTSIYPTVAAGLAATAEGGMFLVASADGDEIYQVWKKVSGAAVDTGKRTLSSQAIEDALVAADASADAAAASAVAAQEAASSAAEQLDGIVEDIGLITSGTIYADDPSFGGNIENAIAALGNNMTLVIRQPYTTTKPLRIVGKTNAVVCCVGAGKLIGSRTAFTFPTAHARGILHFDNCINPVAYRVNILGARTAWSTFGADVKQDGDAGIEHYQCTSPRTIECKVDQVLTWGIIHIGCTDTKAIDNVLTNMSRQSGIGHATVVGGLCRGNRVNYSGLYGIEVEGPGNADINVHDNHVSNCLSGIAIIGDAKSVVVKDNIVELCTYLIQANANGPSNVQAGIAISGNRTYDGRFHYYLSDTGFVDVTGGTGINRVAGAYLPQRPADQVVSVISTTTVLIMDSASAYINSGDIHSYSEGVLRTVDSVSIVTDPTYGSCCRVVYTAVDASIGVGSFFSRNTSFLNGSSNWFYILGSRNNAFNISGNLIGGNSVTGLNISGSMNSLIWSNNKITGAGTVFYAGDATGITNSLIVCSHGDIQTPSIDLFGGASLQKIASSMVGDVRTASMLAPNKPVAFFASSGKSAMVRLRVSLVNTTKTASTGNVIITVNGVSVGTIAVGELGVPLITRDLVVLIAATSFVINVADTFGDMGFASATVESWTVE
ncbi:hypothetical protein HX878_26325 [Pseudomonas veronii]|uniref:hypothetical protein n=1 Tax=Pseudomonas veronii TaxID=76761 RepID=UPI0015A3C710|nr:hypothetical protein [Pseudomonas veronii]NWD58235.1 hypothetical protein [Pseudomonas veronii]